MNCTHCIETRTIDFVFVSDNLSVINKIPDNFIMIIEKFVLCYLKSGLI